MKRVYGYIRVSTVKQGRGVSLDEQKEAIIRYAEKNDLQIVDWFEELETAAKQGRPVFSKLMLMLKTKKADGVIIHKVDRSARNLKDWTALGDLIDKGVEVHFAHESLDLETRGGRLAADIQAVIATDYIRNLRQEAIKGLYGRLKQGLYPWAAPVGYVNNGEGKIKTIDPIQGPLVKKAFEFYASGQYNLDSLTPTMSYLGLRNSKGNILARSGLALILNNPFYAGVMKIKNRTYQGLHEPLVSPALFSQVQDILKGKTNSKHIKHNFLFRKLIKCGECGYSLIGEIQKGKVYYRCQTKECTTKSIREGYLEHSICNFIQKISLTSIEGEILNELLILAQGNWSSNQSEIELSLKLQENKLQMKLDRLADAFIENMIDKETYESKKEQLLIELQSFSAKNLDLSKQKAVIFRKTNKFLELLKNLLNSYKTGIQEEKREIIELITSNFQLQSKKLMFTIQSPFYELGNYLNVLSSGDERNRPRTRTVEIVIPETRGNNQYSPKLYVTDPLPPIVSKDQAPYNLPCAEADTIREHMQELLDIIMNFFSEELAKVDPTIVNEEEDHYALPKHHPGTEHLVRPLPEHVKSKRA